MTAESDFHRRRRAFVILKGGILTAREGFEGSHFDLLHDSGIEETVARRIIEEQPRGYALGGNIYFYQGKDFSRLSEQNQKTALSFLPFFKQLGWLLPSGGVYDGMNVGKVGESWTPIKEIEISF